MRTFSVALYHHFWSVLTISLLVELDHILMAASKNVFKTCCLENLEGVKALCSCHDTSYNLKSVKDLSLLKNRRTKTIFELVCLPDRLQNEQHYLIEAYFVLDFFSGHKPYSLTPIAVLTSQIFNWRFILTRWLQVFYPFFFFVQKSTPHPTEVVQVSKGIVTVLPLNTLTGFGICSLLSSHDSSHV